MQPSQREFRQPGRIPSFILDDLLPADVALAYTRLSHQLMRSY